MAATSDGPSLAFVFRLGYDCKTRDSETETETVLHSSHSAVSQYQ